MSLTYIGAELRRLIVARAEAICEYCLIADSDTLYGCEADHFISEKHGGPTDPNNLALACTCCNRSKGSDVGSIHWESQEFVRFYNPRTDRWPDHFELVGNRLEGLSVIRVVTARILGFNAPDRVTERGVLQRAGRYPCVMAMSRMQTW